VAGLSTAVRICQEHGCERGLKGRAPEELYRLASALYRMAQLVRGL
jgi:hypothetical protein